jgi:hypothetical protein
MLCAYSNQKASDMTEHDDAKMCGICSEPFKDGEVAVQAARWWTSNTTPAPAHLRQVEKFWAHAVCVFTVARETGGASETRIPRLPPEGVRRDTSATGES